MADDPWAAFPLVQGAPAPAAAAPVADAPAVASDGSDPWAAFPLVKGDKGDKGAASPDTTAAAPAAAALPAAPAPQGGGDASAAVGGGIISGAPIVGPYLQAGVERGVVAPLRMLSHGESYPDALKKAQDFDASTSANHPVANAAGQIAGAGLAMAPVAAAAPAVLGLGDGALLGRVAAGAGSGAAIGGADSAARGQDVAGGAVMGSLVGGAAPAVGQVAGAAYQGARGLMGFGSSATAPELQGLGKTARGWLDNGVGDATPSDMQTAAQGVGPSGFFGERTPGLVDLSGSVADNNGPGKAMIRQAYQDRFDGRGDRVNDLVNNNLGPVINPTFFKEGNEAQIGSLGKQRAAMLSSAEPVDVAPVVQGLQDSRGQFAPNGNEQTAIDRGLSLITKPAELPRPGPSGFDADPVGSGIPPDMPNYPDPVPLDNTSAPSKPGPVGVPRPQDLHGFIRSAGGMQDPGGDLSSMGLGNLIAKPGQGLGPDAMRQAAAQSGYLGADVDHAMANTSVNDLLDAVGSDSPIHSVYDQDAVHAWNQRDAAMQAYQQGGAGNVSSTTGVRQPAAPGLPFGGPDVDPNAVPIDLSGASNVPISNATQLHNAKQNFDDVIRYENSGFATPSASIGNAQGVYKDARGGINQALRDQVEGYGPNQDAQASLFAQNRAVDDGMADLTSNKDPARLPETFARNWNTLPVGAPEDSLPAIQNARKIGQRFDIEASLGNKENDFQALRTKMQGEDGWNSQNLGTSFGREKVDAVNQGLAQEVQMAANKQKVMGGSPTGEKVIRNQLTQPTQPSGLLGGAKDWYNNWHLDALPTYLPTKQIWSGVQNRMAETARTQIAPKLVLQGEQADALQQALLAARQRKGLPAPSMDPLVQALLAAGQTGRQRALAQ